MLRTSFCHLLIYRLLNLDTFLTSRSGRFAITCHRTLYSLFLLCEKLHNGRVQSKFCFVKPRSLEGKSVSGSYHEQENHHGSIRLAYIVAKNPGQGLFLHKKSSSSNILEFFYQFLYIFNRSSNRSFAQQWRAENVPEGRESAQLLLLRQLRFYLKQ